MIAYKLTKEIQRKKKKGSKLISVAIVVFAVIFVLMGIIFENGFFFPAFLMAGLYYIYSINSDRAYEYVFDNDNLMIDVIKGKRRRKTTHVIYYKNIEVVATPDHESVMKYKKNGGTEKIPKHDYTSYEDGVPYYTMIAKVNDTKMKFLLDLDEEALRYLKMRFPQKVHTS